MLSSGSYNSENFQQAQRPATIGIRKTLPLKTLQTNPKKSILKMMSEIKLIIWTAVMKWIEEWPHSYEHNNLLCNTAKKNGKFTVSTKCICNKYC